MAPNQSSPKLLRMELSPRLWRCGIAIGCLPAKEKPPVNATLSWQQSASVTSAFSPQWDMFTQMVFGEKGYLATLLAAVCSILSRKRSSGHLTLTAALYMRQPIVPKCWQVEETGLERDPSSCYMKCRVHFGESHISHVVLLALPWITSKAVWTLSLYSDQSSVICQFLEQTATDFCSRAHIHSCCLTIKTRVNSNKRISCLPLALKIWQIFHGQNPHSPSKWMFLTCVAPFKGAKKTGFAMA